MGKIFKQAFHSRRLMDGARWEVRTERAAGLLVGLVAGRLRHLSPGRWSHGQCPAEMQCVLSSERSPGPGDGSMGEGSWLRSSGEAISTPSGPGGRRTGDGDREGAGESGPMRGRQSWLVDCVQLWEMLRSELL